MSITWPDFKARVAELRASIPALQAQHPDEGDFWAAFNVTANAITNAGLDEGQWEYWDFMISDMLIAHGLQDESERQL